MRAVIAISPVEYFECVLSLATPADSLKEVGTFSFDYRYLSF